MLNRVQRLRWIDGNKINDKKTIADEFNKYFIEIIDDNVNYIMPERQNYQTNEQFELNICTENEILSIIKKLNSNASNGFDNISTKFIKKYANIFANPIANFINECFENHTYPDSLKIGCVIRYIRVVINKIYRTTVQ